VSRGIELLSRGWGEAPAGTAASARGSLLLVSPFAGRMITANLAPAVQSLIPDFCDDSEELVINGDRFGLSAS
jgi:hypothetical protein